MGSIWLPMYVLVRTRFQLSLQPSADVLSYFVNHFVLPGQKDHGPFQDKSSARHHKLPPSIRMQGVVGRGC